MSTQLVRSEIQKFLVSEVPGVLCIRGKWGTGKTYMWDEVLLANKSKFKPPHYAYVSLFGLISLDQVKSHVYQTNIGAAYVGEEFSPDNVNALKNEGKKLLKRVAEAASSYFGLGDQIGGFVGNLSTSKLLVCIDDLERIGGGLTVADVLGYATFLSKERNCKVVILLNDEALEGDNKARFESYLEKVVDINLRFAPSPAESASIPIKGTDATSEMVKANCIALGIDNVRVIAKVYRSVQQVEKLLHGYSHEVFKSVLNSVVLFGWSHHQPEIAPSLHFLRTYSSLVWGDRSEDKLTDDGRRWKNIVDDYPFSHVDEFDEELIKGVAAGYFSPDAVANHATDLDKRLAAQAAMDDWQKAWGEWRYSFRSSADEVIKTLSATFLKNTAYYSNDYLNSVYDLCKRMGQAAKAQELLDHFLKVNAANPEAFSFRHSHYHGDDFKPELQEALRTAYEAGKPKHGFEDFLMKLTESYDSDVIEALDKYPSEDFEKVFVSCDGDELRKRIVGVTDLRRIGNPTPHINSVLRKVDDALRRIGEVSTVNHERVRRTWGIKDAPAPEEAANVASVAVKVDGEAVAEPSGGKGGRGRRRTAAKT